MTEEEWHRVGSKRSKLRELLDSEVMQEAMQVLLHSDVAKIDEGGTTAMEVLMYNGVRNIKRAGFHEYAAALRKLATDPEPKKVPPTVRKLTPVRLHDQPEPPK